MSFVDLDKLSPALFPNDESDEFEFKSSATSPNELNKKLNHAASGFANSGGGCFIWGVANATGDADEGVSTKIGNQPLPDWIDKIVHNVVPPPKYSIRVYPNNEGRGILTPGNVIAAVSIHPSVVGPHMANDNRYYIRAGRHTVAANHTIVEALWARRQIQSPRLMLMLRHESQQGGPNIYLEIMNLSNGPAVDVAVDVQPRQIGGPTTWIKNLPLKLPVIDRAYPYRMYLECAQLLPQFLTEHTKIIVKYKDLSGSEYSVIGDASLIQSLPPNIQTWLD